MVNERLFLLLASVFGMAASEISLSLCRSDVAGWDSLKQMDLIVSLENEFQVTFGIAEIARMVNVGEIASVLVEKGVALDP